MQILFKDLTKKKPLKLRFLYVELRDGRFYRSEKRTNIALFYDIWNDKTQTVSTRATAPREEVNKLNEKVNTLRTVLLNRYTEDKSNGRITKEWLKNALENNPQSSCPPKDFNAVFDLFLSERDISDVRKGRYEVVRRLMLRFQEYIRITRYGRSDYKINVSSFSKQDLEDFHEYVINEYKIFEEYPEVAKAAPESRKPTKRGVNTMHSLFACVKAFFTWSVKKKLCENSPFEEFSYENEEYGTPYYLTLQELRQLYEHDFSQNKKKEEQRDIFVFQCNTGPRVKDMMSFTHDNISGDILTYVPQKTKRYRADTITVPLSSTAKEILEKYKHLPDGRILPFISNQNYNDNLKAIFKEAGLNRMIPILDSVTGKINYSPLYEEASSHLARRTFIGNLYKKIKDPNLIGSMSGHAPGSKSFLRYRNIDEDMQREVIKKLEF